MKRREERFGKLVILVTAIVLIASVNIIAYAEDRTKQVAEADEYGSVNPSSKDIVWDNFMNYTGMSMSQISVGKDFEATLADDFMFDVEQRVTDIHWFGGYWDPPGDGNFDWRITFYEDDGSGTKPGAVIASYDFANADVNETFAGSFGGFHFFRYSVYLPDPLTFLAGTKYWISPQGIGTYPPACGWASHSSPVLLHQMVWKSPLHGYPDWTDASEVWGAEYDAAFQLTFETLPVECGDANGSGEVETGDVVYLLNYLFRNWPPPEPQLCVGDVNNDEMVNAADIVYLLSYLYKDGPAPDPDCCTPPWN